MKKKAPWLRYDMKKAEYLEAKEQENVAKRKMEEVAKMLNDLKEPIEYVTGLTNHSYALKVYFVILY